jgi:DNA polymerase-3 subunit delta
MHAAAFVRSKSPTETGPVVVLAGEDRHWKRMAVERLERDILPGDDDQLGLTRLAGDDADLKTVCDELLTVSMWGDRRIVAVEDADRFVSANREGLERYLARPAKKSVLVLDVKTWPKNTRLAKIVPKIGLAIDCSPLAGAELLRWIGETARSEQGKSIDRDAAALMVELAGSDTGQLEQEIAKLASYVGQRGTIGAADVRTLVGGWKTETTWAIAAAIRRGRAGEAIDLLDRLLGAGESPQRIMGGLIFVFRRLADAVEMVHDGASLEGSLREANVFFREVEESAAYLRRLGRGEASRLYARLLCADASLKGASLMSEREVLETLIVELSGAAR